MFLAITTGVIATYIDRFYIQWNLVVLAYLDHKSYRIS
jgi:hypothetical protein